MLIQTYNRVMKNLVCLTGPSVRTVPFATSNPKSFRAFICPPIKINQVTKTTNISEHVMIML